MVQQTIHNELTNPDIRAFIQQNIEGPFIHYALRELKKTLRPYFITVVVLLSVLILLNLSTILSLGKIKRS